MGVVSRRLAAVAATVVFAAVGGAGANASNGAKPPGLQFLGQAIVPTGATFAGTTVGGLSSITYDAGRGVFYSLSDDQSQFNPARFYTLHSTSRTAASRPATFTSTRVTTLLAPDGLPYAPFSLDPEGLTLTKSGELVVTSEGIAVRGIPAFVRRYSLDGRSSATFPCRPRSTRRARRTACGRTSPSRPPRSRRTAGTSSSGWRTRSHRTVPRRRSPTGARRASSATTWRRSASTGSTCIWTIPSRSRPCRRRSSRSTGSLSCSRSTTSSCSRWSGRSPSARPAPATRSSSTRSRSPERDDVNGFDSIASLLGSIRPAQKTLLLDLRTLGIPLDNIEGMTIGPRLPDGRRSLVLVSDNNFAASQFTQFLLFALD